MRRRILTLPLLLMLLLAATTSYNEIVWNDNTPLAWEDFNHQHKNDHYAALTASGISYSYTTKPTSYEVEIYAVFDKDESWVNVNKASDRLLVHEDLHFDITELWTRRLRKAVQDATYVDGEVFNALYDKHIKGLTRMQAFYDEETHHSLRKKSQHNWEKRVALELTELRDYTDPIITKSREIVAQQ